MTQSANTVVSRMLPSLVKLNGHQPDKHGIINLKLTARDRENLESCPFCGGDDLELSNTHTACYWVSCLACEEAGFRVEVTGRSFGGDRPSEQLSLGQHRRAKASAIEGWNRRSVAMGPAAL